MRSHQQTALMLYRKLLSLYPRAFREQLGESMEQTFRDLYAEQRQQTKRGQSAFIIWIFAETAIGALKEHVLLHKKGTPMGSMLAHPRSAAIIGFLLCLPCAILFSLLTLNIEPHFGPLEPILNNPDPDQPNVIGSLIALGLFLLLPIAFLIVQTPIRRTLRAGGALFAHPMNLIIASAILLLFATIVGALIVDQYPCWIGVPNCD